MNKFDYFFFDFDGTIFDTSLGVFNGFDRVIKHYKLDFPKDQYKRMIGPPLKESFVKILNLPEQEIQNAIKVYRDYYTPIGLYECTVYPGVIELIDRLRAIGKKVFVCTSKPEIFAREILKRNNLLDHFDFVGGSEVDETKGRVEKIDVIRYIFQTQNIEEKEKCLMIGDRKYDIIGAKAAGIKCAAILWGFGDREEFQEYKADYIYEKPEELMELA